jgi:hypothetical protein
MQGLIHPMWGRGVFLFDCELGGNMYGGGSFCEKCALNQIRSNFRSGACMAVQEF